MADYQFFNNNPLGKIESDCVYRAISLASNRPYQEIKEKLYYISRLLECDALCICCYQHLLDDVFQYQKICCKGMTVSDIARKYPKGRLLVRMNGHISTIIDSVVYDIWDCREELVTDCWRVE